MKCDLKPRDIMTAAAFENAMVLIMATGGSTNAGAVRCDWVRDEAGRNRAGRACNWLSRPQK